MKCLCGKSDEKAINLCGITVGQKVARDDITQGTGMVIKVLIKAELLKHHLFLMVIRKILLSLIQKESKLNKSWLLYERASLTIAE